MDKIVLQWKSKPQEGEIILSNIGIVLGIIVLQWDIGILLASYWVETSVVTIFFVLNALKDRIDQTEDDERNHFIPMLLYIVVFGIFLRFQLEWILSLGGMALFFNIGMYIFIGYLILTFSYTFIRTRITSHSWIYHYQSVFKRISVMHMILFCLGLVIPNVVGASLWIPIAITVGKTYAELQAVGWNNHRE